MTRLRAGLARMAAAAPVRLFAAAGADARERVEGLGLRPDVELVGSPRRADLLLVAGRIPSRFHRELGRVHDQLPHPRGTLLWDASAPPIVLGVPVRGSEDPVEAAQTVRAEILRGERESESAWLPDEPPAPWRGRGDHGQGGEGMMGGAPYGRPMAMTSEDLRDGLALDRLGLGIGPFFPHLPPGLRMEVELQGDVVQSVKVTSPALPQAPPEIFRHVLSEPAPVADLERARCRALVYGAARTLRATGAAAPASRLLRLGSYVWSPGASGGSLDRAREKLHHVRKVLTASGILAASAGGVGALTRDQATRLGGPTARAAGAGTDLRNREPDYQRLGFAAVRPGGRDAAGRVLQCLAEAAQALRLAGRAAQSDLSLGPVERVEGPHGRLLAGDGGAIEREGAPDRHRVLADLLPGREWGDAVLTVASLHLAPPA